MKHSFSGSVDIAFISLQNLVFMNLEIVRLTTQIRRPYHTLGTMQMFFCYFQADAVIIFMS